MLRTQGRVAPENCGTPGLAELAHRSLTRLLPPRRCARGARCARAGSSSFPSVLTAGLLVRSPVSGSRRKGRGPSSARRRGGRAHGGFDFFFTCTGLRDRVSTRIQCGLWTGCGDVKCLAGRTGSALHILVVDACLLGEIRSASQRAGPSAGPGSSARGITHAPVRPTRPRRRDHHHGTIGLMQDRVRDAPEHAAHPSKATRASRS
jgi:hypothetical protein